jgi:ubiquinone/menaquinone biosynthesis C-methylase UbiE
MAASTASNVLSAGVSQQDIVQHALALADARPGLSWLDIGCGRGALLRAIRDRHAPARLMAIDLIDWLDDDLRDDVDLAVEPVETALGSTPPVDRVMVVEVFSSLESPWTALRQAAQLVRPGGRLVICTVNIATLRHRLELVCRGALTSFRPNEPFQLTPPVPHAIERVLGEEGLTTSARSYTAADVIPLTGGRTWPEPIRRAAPRLTSVTVALYATRGDVPPQTEDRRLG